MKLHKLILITASLFAITGITACSGMSNDKDGIHYYLHVEGPGKEICPNLPKEGWYRKNKKITFKTTIVTDVSFYVFLNNEVLDCVRSGDHIGDYCYYEFKMPAQETFLAISSNRYYVSRDYSFSEVNFWADNIINSKSSIDEITIEEEDVFNESNNNVVHSKDPRDIEYNVAILENEKLTRVLDEPSKHDFAHTKKIVFIFDDGTEYTIDFFPYIIYQEWAYNEYFTFANIECQGFMIKYPNTEA